MIIAWGNNRIDKQSTNRTRVQHVIEQLVDGAQQMEISVWKKRWNSKRVEINITVKNYYDVLKVENALKKMGIKPEMRQMTRFSTKALEGPAERTTVYDISGKITYNRLLENGICPKDFHAR